LRDAFGDQFGLRGYEPLILRIATDRREGRAKLAVYSGSTLSLNHHHPMNDIVGVNTRAFELAAAGACQLVDFKEDLATLFKPGEELVAYRDLPDLRRQLDYHLAHPDEAVALGAEGIEATHGRDILVEDQPARHQCDGCPRPLVDGPFRVAEQGMVAKPADPDELVGMRRL
jgi:hypothetical protein